jgi:hypothetical protein
MIRVELTPEEAALLREVLVIYLTDFRRQVAGTENPDFRHALERRQGFVEDLVERLEEAGAPYRAPMPGMAGGAR